MGIEKAAKMLRDAQPEIDKIREERKKSEPKPKNRKWRYKNV